MIAIVNRTLISDEDLSVQLKISAFFQPGLKVSFKKKTIGGNRKTEHPETLDIGSDCSTHSKSAHMEFDWVMS